MSKFKNLEIGNILNQLKSESILSNLFICLFDSLLKVNKLMRKRISGLMDCKLLLGENFENKEPKFIYILLNTFKVEAI